MQKASKPSHAANDGDSLKATADEKSSQLSGNTSNDLRARAKEYLSSHDNDDTPPVASTSGAQQIHQRDIFKESPKVHYLNGESLNRPLSLPQPIKFGTIVICIIAALLMGITLFVYIDRTAHQPAQEQAKLDEVISKTQALNLPNLLQLVSMDDAQIDETLKALGNVYYEKSPVGSGAPYCIIKLPEGLDVASAAAMYAEGINKISASQAATLLNGSWELEIDRSKGYNMSLHYVDFSAKNATDAVSKAVITENLDRGTVKDSGDNDGFGNAFTNGTIMLSSVDYTWSVSAIPLNKVYSIAGMPDNVTYVGVRIRS